MNPVLIRVENTGDAAEARAIWVVNQAAFGRPEEAGLVDKLRADGHALVSVVAEFERAIVGQALFSRMWIKTASGLVPAVALAPVAVLPEHQRKGIGQQLIVHGLDILRGQGESIVIVVGHPGYYPRFGFSQEKAALLEGPFSREAFMAMELVNGTLHLVTKPSRARKEAVLKVSHSIRLTPSEPYASARTYKPENV